MKKGVFGSWFKELATLIFTQTVQAFLLAIVMTIIISASSQQPGKKKPENPTYAAGLLAIVALSQFGKIEMLVKNIFGVTSQYGDPAMQNGKGGLLLGAMALRGAKKGLDNAGKIIGGARERGAANNRLKDLQNQRAMLGADEAALTEEGALNEMTSTASEVLGDMSTGATRAAGAQIAGEMGGVAGGGSGVGVPSSQIDSLIQAIRAQTDAIKSGGGSGSKAETIKDKQLALDQQIEQAKLDKKMAGRKIRSGIAETVLDAGALGIGMAYGTASGDGAVAKGLAAVNVADSTVSGTVNVMNRWSAQGVDSRSAKRSRVASEERLQVAKSKEAAHNANATLYKKTTENIKKLSKDENLGNAQRKYKVSKQVNNTIAQADKKTNASDI